MALPAALSVGSAEDEQKGVEVRTIDILLVEDNPGDVRLTTEAFNRGKIRSELHVVTDGIEAMNYLYRRGEYEEAHRPDIILLDLNLPQKDGREVLREIKSDESLSPIPIVILTTSKAEEDIVKTYALHANCYITKPVDLFQFFDVIKSIEDFWLTIVKLPGKGHER